MAQDGDSPSSTGEIADRLGKSTTKLAVIRSRLIAEGVVYAPEFGYVGSIRVIRGWNWQLLGLDVVIVHRFQVSSGACLPLTLFVLV